MVDLPKLIKYGSNGKRYAPEVKVIRNMGLKWEGQSKKRNNFPIGSIIWCIRYKDIESNWYINTNDSSAWDRTRLEGIGLTLIEAIEDIEKELETKTFDDLSSPSEKEKAYYEGHQDDIQWFDREI